MLALHSKAKDDPTDVELAFDLMLNYTNKIKAFKMENKPIQKLGYCSRSCFFSMELVSKAIVGRPLYK
ncbi:MAG: hypothetical protein ACJAXS_000237 [Colwellia sp.]|jgi:hypothetical protein